MALQERYKHETKNLYQKDSKGNPTKDHPLINKVYPLLDPDIIDRVEKHLVWCGFSAKMNMSEMSPGDFAKKAPSLGSFLPSRKVLKKLI